MYYNFVRIHKTPRMRAAMAANITKRLWEISDILDVFDAWEASNDRQDSKNPSYRYRPLGK